MKVHTPAELQGMQADETFRTPPWAALMFPAFSLTFCISLGWLTLRNGYITDGFFWVCWPLFLALFVLFPLYRNFIPAFYPSNWILKATRDRLYLMLRDYRNTHLPDDAAVIVSFESSEIESIGQQAKLISVPESNGGTCSWTERRLEIRLRDQVPQEFITTLKAQPEWSDTSSMFFGWLRIRSMNAPTPVTYDDRVIRITWSGSTSVGVWPPINRAIAILGRIVPIHDKSTIDRRQWAHMTDTQFDDYILELCQAGDRIDAVKLLRERRNYSLTEAQRFIDEISGYRNEKSRDL